MKSRPGRSFVLTALVVTLVLAVSVAFDKPASAALSTVFNVRGGIGEATQPPSAKSFVIMIAPQGFDNNASIVVNQGDTVKITFVMSVAQAADKSAANHHVIAIDGYNIASADINPTHLNATVSFTASKVGTFSIYCDTPECPIHGLMVSGTVEVDAAGPAGGTTTITTGGPSTTSTSGTSTTATPPGGGTTPTTTVTVTQPAVPAASSGLDTGTLETLLVVLAVVALLGGAMIARFTAPGRSQVS